MSPVADPRNSSKARAVYVEDQTRNEYYKALIVGGIGVAILSWLILSSFGIVGGAFGMIGVFIMLAIRTVIAFLAAFLFASVFKVSLGTLGLVLLRLVCLMAFVTATGSVLISFAWCAGWFMNLAIMALLVAWLFELEVAEGVWFVLFLVAAEIGALIALLSMGS